METNKSLQVIGQGSVPAFVEAQMASLDGAMKYADALLKSKMCPGHFYEKGTDNKPDYTKGKPEAVLMVLQHGREIGLSYMQSLQQIVPVNGLVAIKGDGAKSLIMGSGKCEKWSEAYFGEPFKDDYGCEITAKRKDTGEEKTIRFTVADARRAGLWVTDDMAARTPNLKYGGWYKYPNRMVRYRALGFMARDLFADVLLGTYIEEEAKDIDVDNNVVKSEETGMTIDHSKIEKADSITEGAKTVKSGKGKVEKNIPIQPSENKAEPDKKEVTHTEQIASEPEKKSITEGMLNLKGPELWERVTNNWPYPQIDPLRLYGAEKNPRTAPKVRALLTAIENGSIEAHLAKEYGISFNSEQAKSEDTDTVKKENPAPKKEVALPDYINEPGETGRDMMAAVKVADFMEGKVSQDKILDMFTDSFNDIEDFFKQATIEQIKQALA